MEISYSEPCDAVTLRIFEQCFTPPFLTSSTNTKIPTTDDVHEDNLFKLFQLHFTTQDHVNYIESTTGMTILMAVATTIHFNIPRRLSLFYYLLNRQCDLNIANLYTKKTAFHYLLEHLQTITIPIINLIYHLLTKYSADINGVDSQGRIPMTYLVSNAHLPITPLFIALMQLLFTHNPSPYPLDHQPLSIALSYYVFGNQRYCQEIQFPANAYDFIDATKSQIALLPYYDSIIAPIQQTDDNAILSEHGQQDHAQCVHGNEITNEINVTQASLTQPPPLPIAFTTLFSQFEQHEAHVLLHLADEEWKYYKYYLFSLLQQQRQSIFAACSIESLDYPQFYSIEYSNPLFQQHFSHVASMGKQAHFAILPAPIHQLFTIIPKLDVAAIRNYPLSDTSTSTIVSTIHTNTATQSDPMPSTNIFAAPIIPSLSMLRCLFLQDEYLLADVHNHIILFLQAHPYITPQHIELIKFLFILRKDYNHELSMPHILEVLTITFKCTFTIPTAQLLNFSESHFNPSSNNNNNNNNNSVGSSSTPSPSPDYYGIIPSRESEWTSSMIEKRTAPYIDLLAFCFALFEHAYYRDSCPFRNPSLSTNAIPKHTSATTQTIIEHLLFISCAQSNHLYPQQILPIHTFILYYTPLSNKYCNIPFLINTFNHFIPQIHNTTIKPFTSNDDIIPVPQSLTSFTPHTLQTKLLQSIDSSMNNSFLDTYSLIDAIFKPLNGTQASSAFHVVSNLESNFSIPPDFNSLSDKSTRLYGRHKQLSSASASTKQSIGPVAKSSKNKKPLTQAAIDKENKRIEQENKRIENLATQTKFMEEIRNVLHLSDEERAASLPVPVILDARSNNYLIQDTFTPPLDFNFSIHSQIVLHTRGFSDRDQRQRLLREQTTFDLPYTPLDSFHYGYSDALLSKATISKCVLTSRANIDLQFTSHYRLELVAALQKSTSPFSLVNFTPIQQSPFPILMLPTIDDTRSVFSYLFDIPLIFKSFASTDYGYPLGDKSNTFNHSILDEYDATILTTLTIFNKHNRDYNQLVNFMNIHAEFYDLTIPFHYLQQEMEGARQNYFLLEQAILKDRVDDLRQRIIDSQLSQQSQPLLNSLPAGFVNNDRNRSSVPLNFYNALSEKFSAGMDLWYSMPLFTTFKYLFENTSVVSYTLSHQDSFFTLLIQRCHFHKVTDYDCEQLWDYLRFELNLNPVLIEASLAKHYLSHSRALLQTEGPDVRYFESTKALVTDLIHSWYCEILLDVIDDNSAFDFLEYYRQYALKKVEFASNPDELVQWVIDRYSFPPLDAFSDADDVLISLALADFATQEIIESVKDWVIFFRKVIYMLPLRYSLLNEDFILDINEFASVIFHLSPELSSQVKQQYHVFSQLFHNKIFEPWASSVLSNIIINSSPSTSQNIPTTYNQFKTLHPTPDFCHTMKIIQHCQSIDGDWYEGFHSYTHKDNFFWALLNFIEDLLNIPEYVFSYHFDPTPQSFALGFPSGTTVPPQISHEKKAQPPPSRFFSLFLQDLLQSYLKLPNQLFNEMVLPPIDTSSLPPNRSIKTFSQFTFESVASQLGQAIAEFTQDPSVELKINTIIPPAQPLKYYNHTTQEMVFKHSISFPHIDSTIPPLFQDALQFNPESLHLTTSDDKFELICQQIMNDQHIPVNPLFVTHKHPHFESYACYLELQRYHTPDETLKKINRISTLPTFHPSTTQVIYISSKAIPIGTGYQLIVDQFPALFFQDILPQLSTTPASRLKARFEHIYVSYIIINAGNFASLLQGTWGSFMYAIFSTNLAGSLPLANTRCTSGEAEHANQFIQYCMSPDSNIYSRCQHCIESNQIIHNSIYSFTKPVNPLYSPEIFNLLFEYFVPLLYSQTNGFIPLVRSRGVDDEFAPISSDSSELDHYLMKWKPHSLIVDSTTSSIPTDFWLYPFQNYTDFGSSFNYHTISSSAAFPQTELTPYQLATSYFFTSICEHNFHQGATDLQTLQFPTLSHRLAALDAYNDSTAAPTSLVAPSTSKTGIIRFHFDRSSVDELFIQSHSGLLLNFLVNGIFREIKDQLLPIKGFHRMGENYFAKSSRMFSFSFNTPHTPVTKSLFSITSQDQKRIDAFDFDGLRLFSPHISTRTSSTNQISYKLLQLVQQLSPLLTTQDRSTLSRSIFNYIGRFFSSNRGSKPPTIPITYSITKFAKINPTIASFTANFNPHNCTLKQIYQLFGPSYSEPIDGYTDLDLFALQYGLFPGLLPTMSSSNALTHDYFGQVQSAIFQQQFLASRSAYQQFLSFKSTSNYVDNGSTPHDDDDYALVPTTFQSFIETQASSSATSSSSLPIHQTAFKSTRFFSIVEEYIKFLFSTNIFTVFNSDLFAALFTQISSSVVKKTPQFARPFFYHRLAAKLSPLDLSLVDFYKNFFLNYYQPLLLNAGDISRSSPNNTDSSPPSSSMTSSTVPIEFAESSLTLSSFYEEFSTPDLKLEPSEHCTNSSASTSHLQPEPLLLQASLVSQKSSRALSSSALSQFPHLGEDSYSSDLLKWYHTPQRITNALVKSAQKELSNVDQNCTVLLTQMAQTLFSHRYPPHDFFNAIAKVSAEYIQERQEDGALFLSNNFALDNDISITQTASLITPQNTEIINFFRTILISFLDSPTPSPSQIQFIQWLVQFGHVVLPYELQQVSILFPPNADSRCTANVYALGEHSYATPLSISVLFQSALPTFYQTKLFSSIISAPNTPLQRTSRQAPGSVWTLATSNSHEDIMGWLIRSYQPNNPFWLTELISLLTCGGTFTTPLPFQDASTFQIFQKLHYQSISQMNNSSSSIMNFLPISPSQKQYPVEHYIWQLIKQYHMINMQPRNQFMTPVDSLLHHPVVELSLFWKKIYQFALVSVYHESFTTQDLSQEQSNIEFDRSYQKHPKFTLPQLLDHLDALIQLYNQKSDELVHLVEGTKALSFDVDGNVVGVLCNVNSTLFEQKHAELFSFLNEYRYYIDTLLPYLDLYPNFSSTADKKLFCICKTDALTSLYSTDTSIDRVYETCPFCIYKTMNRFQTRLIQFGRLPDSSVTCDTFNQFVDNSMYTSDTIHTNLNNAFTHDLNTKQHQRSPQYILDFIADILHPVDSTSPYFTKHHTLSLPALAPFHDCPSRSLAAISQQLKQVLSVTTIDQLTDDNNLNNAEIVVVLDHTLPSHHHDPLEVSFHLPSTHTRPSITTFTPTFTQGMLWHLLTTTHLDTDDIVALLSSPHLSLYNTATNVNHLNHTTLHHALLLHSHPVILQSLWSSLTSPHSHSTTQYHDVTYDILFSKDVFNWTLLDYIQLTQSWNFAPEWTKTILTAYQEYDSTITLAKYRQVIQ